MEKCLGSLCPGFDLRSKGETPNSDWPSRGKTPMGWGEDGYYLVFNSPRLRVGMSDGDCILHVPSTDPKVVKQVFAALAWSLRCSLPIELSFELDEMERNDGLTSGVGDSSP